MTTNVKDWYNEGVRAFKNGKDINDCEYDEETEAYNAWRDGWMDTDYKYDPVEED